MNFLKSKIPHSFRVRYGSRWHKISDPIYTVYSKIKRQFVRPPFPKLENGEINLHLGCGPINHPAFINVDLRPKPHIHYVRSIDNLSPWKDDSVDLIYACHCLEHFSHQKTKFVLSEWFRVLKKGGILRLSVPDFNKLLEIYLDHNRDIQTILNPLMGGQSYKFNFHMTIFTKDSLAQILKDIGFKEVRDWEAGSSNLMSFKDQSSKLVSFSEGGKKYSRNLNIEAIKP